MSKTKKLTRLRKAAMFTVCVYCGHRTPSRHPGDVNREAIFAHVMQCPNRPEARMANHIMLCHAAIRYARDTMKQMLEAGLSAEATSGASECISELDSLLSMEPKA